MSRRKVWLAVLAVFLWACLASPVWAGTELTRFRLIYSDDQIAYSFDSFTALYDNADRKGLNVWIKIEYKNQEEDAFMAWRKVNGLRPVWRDSVAYELLHYYFDLTAGEARLTEAICHEKSGGDYDVMEFQPSAPVPLLPESMEMRIANAVSVYAAVKPRGTGRPDDVWIPNWPELRLGRHASDISLAKSLGRPNSVVIYDEPMFIGSRYCFDTVQVELVGKDKIAGEISRICIIRPDLTTTRDVRVGDSAAKIWATYGPPAYYTRSVVPYNQTVQEVFAYFIDGDRQLDRIAFVVDGTSGNIEQICYSKLAGGI